MTSHYGDQQKCDTHHQFRNSYCFNGEKKMNDHQPKYLTEDEVSEITKMSLSTLRNNRFMGRGILYIKIGRSVRYNLSDVIQFMESRKIQTE